MGEFNHQSYQAAMERAQAAKRGEPLPKPPVQRREPKQPLARFDVEAAKKRAQEKSGPVDMEKLEASL